MNRQEEIKEEIKEHLENIKRLRKLLSEEEEQLQICYNALNANN